MARWPDLTRLSARLRGRPLVSIDTDVETRAAVAAILRPRGDDLEALLIRRAEREGDRWSGHMAFPGGRQDPEDQDLLATARRETLEEVGIDLAQGAELLGRLDDLAAGSWTRPTAMTVSPFVFALQGEPALSLSDEVAEALWVPLRPLREGAADAIYEFSLQGQMLPMPAFRVGDRIVWGLTYRMIQAIFEDLASSGP